MGVSNTNDTIADVSSAYVAQEANNPFNFDQTISLPPPGTCTAYTYAADFSNNSDLPPGLPNSRPTGRALDAGVTAIVPQSTLFGYESRSASDLRRLVAMVRAWLSCSWSHPAHHPPGSGVF